MDLIAEQAVLSTLINDAKTLDKYIDIILVDMFYKQQHIEILESIKGLVAQKKPVDFVTLNSEIPNYTEYILDITSEFSFVANIKHYIDILEEKKQVRQTVFYAQEILTMVSDGDDPREFAETYDFNFYKGSEEMENVFKNSYHYLEKIEEEHQSDKMRGIETGYKDIDYKLGGLKGGDLILLGARPSMGKTALALNISTNIAKNNKNVAFFSLEMVKRKLMQRVLFSESRVSQNNLRDKQISINQFDKISKSAATLFNENMYVSDKSNTVLDISYKCKMLKKKHGIDLIVVDHLSLIEESKQFQSETYKVAYDTRKLKLLANELNVPIVLLAQLSRKCEMREDKRPVLSDLRDSGAIEQDADVVMFLYRDEYYNPDTDLKGVAEVLIRKNRDGETGTVPLAWFPSMSRFDNLQR